MLAPKNILIPTDFSKYSEKAFKYALDMAKCNNSRVFVIHVIDENIQQIVAEYCMNPGIAERVANESIITSNENMQRLISRFPESKEIKIIADVKRGVPYVEILKSQQEYEIDIIIIASHGKTDFKGPLIGSVAERVIEGAGCPVLLVK